MATETSQLIYLRLAFRNAKRCLREASDASHSYAQKSIVAVNPETNKQENIMSPEFALKWAMKYHLKNWSASTWRLIRCGYKAMLENMVSQGALSPEVAKKMIGIAGAQRAQPKAKRRKEKKLLWSRKKYLSEENLARIEDHISDSRYRWGEALVYWLKASMLTGLRPNEWQFASLTEKDGKVLLKTKNFKYSKVRSYAEDRTIDIGGLSKEHILDIKRHLAIVKGMKDGGMFDQLRDGCAYLLYKLNIKLFPYRKSNITLYTGRHQFSSNAKKDSDVSSLERAAMMGHKTTRTSAKGYGLTKRGSKGLTPEISDKSVLGLIQDIPHVREPKADGPNLKNKDK